MKRLLRKFLSQKIINIFWHLPMAFLANLKYGFPSRKLKVIGVTGTDGKTTTSNMIYQILKMDGKKVSLISTINAIIGNKKYETGFHTTSPSSFAVQKFLKEGVEMRSEYMVLEVTSHALDQYRFWGINFLVGVITNITHEHLDYHKSFENYLNSKAKLIKNTKFAILNHDEDHFERLSKLTKGKVISFGSSKNSDFNPIKFALYLKVPGEFNYLNALGASAVAHNLGVSSSNIKKALANFLSLKGRMEEIKNDLGIKIVVDFAHTPNGLEQVLKTLRKKTKGKLISVFGSASERDFKKRPIMGEISGRLADITVLTTEDPRREDPQKIMDEIASGVEDAKMGETLFEETDRQKAIELALSLAKRGDTIGIFGKGHELSMNIGGVELPWSDQKAVLNAIKDNG
ncbi:UDP-N-acetylmuramoyl-L-alanyl-D-glutamate--2,6-diaminopimelate ligase [Candidatus Daviesbacteria bacterium]|nr:UDP-N-acetylmuramoyl-L-alanyl-D-glutamate--2,6-diaminopimelate ligase [Candidatus Daviesbacteria bacterium]